MSTIIVSCLSYLGIYMNLFRVCLVFSYLILFSLVIGIIFLIIFLIYPHYCLLLSISLSSRYRLVFFSFLVFLAQVFLYLGYHICLYSVLDIFFIVGIVIFRSAPINATTLLIFSYIISFLLLSYILVYLYFWHLVLFGIIYINQLYV